MNNLSSVIQRAKAPTPVFFQKLRNTGLVLTAVSGTLLMSPLALPAVAVTAAKYIALAASVLSAVSQTTVEDTVKHIEEVYE